MDRTQVNVSVTGQPPIKRGPGGVTQIRQRQKQRRSESAEVLASAVSARLQELGFEPGLRFPWNPMTARIHLAITMIRGGCKADAANIIGGVADELQGVLYSDDYQLGEIVYRETPSEDGQDSYTITVCEFDEQPVTA